jgi:hypothetical protein
LSILFQLIVSFFDSRATGFYVLLSIRGRQARSPFFFVCSLYMPPILEPETCLSFFNARCNNNFYSREIKDLFYLRLPPLICNLNKPVDWPSAIASVRACIIFPPCLKLKSSWQVKWDIDELAHSHSAWTEQLPAEFNKLCVQVTPAFE